ncbi:MAG: STAS domain-containing protein [Perlabentimonas sp.]
MAKSQKITLKAQPVKGKAKGKKEVVLIIQGELTLDSCQQMKDFLVENLKKYNHFVVKINSVESIDLGAVQILQRFMWDVQAESKTSEFDIKIPEDFRILLENSGLTAFLALSK